MHNTPRTQETNIPDVIGIRILYPTNRAAADRTATWRGLLVTSKVVGTRKEGKTGEKEGEEGVKLEGAGEKEEKRKRLQRKI